MASYAPFETTIANVSGALFAGTATLVSVPSTDGVLTVLAHHEPLIALLTKGTVLVRDESEKEHTFIIEGGVIEIHANKTVILV